jgi:hypothetical protein
MFLLSIKPEFGRFTSSTIQLKSDSGESLNIVASNASSKPTTMIRLCSATFQLLEQFV